MRELLRLTLGPHVFSRSPFLH